MAYSKAVDQKLARKRDTKTTRANNGRKAEDARAMKKLQFGLLKQEYAEDCSGEDDPLSVAIEKQPSPRAFLLPKPRTPIRIGAAPGLVSTHNDPKDLLTFQIASLEQHVADLKAFQKESHDKARLEHAELVQALKGLVETMTTSIAIQHHQTGSMNEVLNRGFPPEDSLRDPEPKTSSQETLTKLRSLARPTVPKKTKEMLDGHNNEEEEPEVTRVMVKPKVRVTMETPSRTVKKRKFSKS
ncbi:hypothetical protein F4774DRAFT_136985 [Daldinia eschscholtzii]|nr:hypothetical protein F4774DRAFT_136985 [Daldinia eschscholtzii]